MTIGRRVVLAFSALLVTTGCATGTSSLSDRFIRQGTPAIDLGGPAVVWPNDVSADFRRRMAALKVPAAPKTPNGPPARTSGASLEASSPLLRRALQELAAAPTSDNYLDTAHAYLAEGVRDRAYDYLAAGLRQDRRNATLHDATARLWRDWGMHDRALVAAHAAVYYAPQSAEARNTLGTVLWALRLRPEAMRAFAEAAALAPEAWYPWHNLCQMERADGPARTYTVNCQRAIQLQERARRNRP